MPTESISVIKLSIERLVNFVPSRGDFIKINFDPQYGYEQMGNRPALIVSHSDFNRYRGFAFVHQISNTKRRKPFYLDDFIQLYIQ